MAGDMNECGTAACGHVEASGDASEHMDELTRSECIVSEVIKGRAGLAL